MNHRILCSIDGLFRVQRLNEGDDRHGERWVTVHICKAKHEAGYTEARAWIDNQTKGDTP